ncbi:hypothetical protein [Pseudomonas chlororaphis]|uniref:hypothetical protein n=1 Tax=Pseudomonas chlororaphis TaxID=587753 RepID=UPI0012FE254E|nr:hypothetical protein [Pseudomonas chlororaphis]
MNYESFLLRACVSVMADVGVIQAVASKLEAVLQRGSLVLGTSSIYTLLDFQGADGNWQSAGAER